MVQALVFTSSPLFIIFYLKFIQVFLESLFQFSYSRALKLLKKKGTLILADLPSITYSINVASTSYSPARLSVFCIWLLRAT